MTKGEAKPMIGAVNELFPLLPPCAFARGAPASETPQQREHFGTAAKGTSQLMWL